MQSDVSHSLVRLLFGNAENDASNVLAELKALSRPPSVCGHVFGKGEPTYQCADCSIDPTCVVCLECFELGDHRLHNYRMNTSSGGGCCDCGDHEAWKCNASCSVHAGSFDAIESYDPTALMSDDLVVRIRRALHGIFTYMGIIMGLWSGSSWGYGPPSANILLAMFGGEEIRSSEFKPVFSKATIDFLRGEFDVASQLGCAAMLMNDEMHTFDFVIAQLTSGLPCDTATANMLADVVDQKGRAVIVTGSYGKCHHVSNIVSNPETSRHSHTLGHGTREPLHTVVLSAWSMAHESMCLFLVPWLKALCRDSDGLKRLICEAMLRPILRPAAFPSFIGRELSISETTGVPTVSLLDTLLIADCRLWKAARQRFHMLYMSCLLADPVCKVQFSTVYLRHYAEMMRGHLRDDQAANDSAISLSVQIFTVPSLVRSLVKEHRLLEVIFDTLRDMFSSCLINPSGGSSNVGANDDLVLDCESSTMHNKRYHHAMGDPRYILRHDNLEFDVDAVLDSVIRFLQVFQEMDKVQRAVDQHVEYESESWMSAFSVYLFMVPFLPLLVRLFSGDGHDRFLKAVHMVADKLLHSRSLSKLRYFPKMPRYSQLCGNAPLFLSEYDVALQPISVHLVMHRMLAGLFVDAYKHNCTIADIITATIDVSPSNEDSELLQPPPLTLAALKLLEHPLRLFTFLSQVRVGMWRRNGFSVRNQLCNYISIRFRDQTYDLDLALLQALSTCLNPDHFLITVIYRHGLKDFFIGFDHSGKDFVSAAARDDDCLNVLNAEKESSLSFNPIAVKSDDNLQNMAEDLLQLLVAIISERYLTGVGEVTEHEILRRKVIHLLACGPAAYSEISTAVLRPYAEPRELDHVLFEVAHFRYPESADAGIYELKTKFFSEYNPFFHHYSRRDREKAHERMSGLIKQQGAEFAPLPPLPILVAPFKGVEMLLGCRTLIHIVVTSLRRGLQPVGYECTHTLLHQSLHLLVIGLRAGPDGTPLSAFVNAVALYSPIVAAGEDVAEATVNSNDSSRPVSKSLFSVLLALRKHISGEGHQVQIDWIISSFRSAGNDTIIQLIQDAEASRAMAESPSTQRKRRALEARQRQANIMAQFSKMQRTFVDSHQQLYTESEVDDARASSPAHVSTSSTSGILLSPSPGRAVTSVDDEVVYDSVLSSTTDDVVMEDVRNSGECILCQESVIVDGASDRPLGMLVYIQRSNLLGQLVPRTLDDDSSQRGLDGSCGSLVGDSETCTFTGTIENEEDFTMADSGAAEDLRQIALQTDVDGDIVPNPHLQVYSGAGPLLHNRGNDLDESGDEGGEGDMNAQMDLFMAAVREAVNIAGTGTGHTDDAQNGEAVNVRGPDVRETLGGLGVGAANIFLQQLSHPAVGTIFPSPVSGGNNATTDTDEEVLIRSLNLRESPPEHGIVMSTCGHCIHGDCHAKYMASLDGWFSRLLARQTELVCPLCKSVSNALLPLVPPHVSSGALPLPCSIESWLALMHTVRDSLTTLSGYVSSSYSEPLSRMGLSQFKKAAQECCTSASPKVVSLLTDIVPTESQTSMSPQLLTMVDSWTYRVRNTYQAGQSKRDNCGFDFVVAASSSLAYTLSCIEVAARSSASVYASGTFNERAVRAFIGLCRVAKTVCESYPRHIARKSVSRLWMLAFGEPNCNGNGDDHDESFLDLDRFSSFVTLQLVIPFRLVESGDVEVHFGHSSRLVVLAEVAAVLVDITYNGLEDDEVNIRSNEDESLDVLDKLLHYIPARLRCNRAPLGGVLRRVELAMLPLLWRIALFKHVFLEVPPWSGDSNVVNTAENAELLRGDPNLLNSLTNYIFDEVSGTDGKCYDAITYIIGPLMVDREAETLINRWTSRDLIIKSPLPRFRDTFGSPFELVSLPEEFNHIFHLANAQTCSKRGGSERFSPALCLICGSFVCSESTCCASKAGGGCNTHAVRCGAGVSIFLLVKRCAILMLFTQREANETDTSRGWLQRGCLYPSPYVDAHGETDVGLRRGNPLRLNRTRYSRLRKRWVDQHVTDDIIKSMDEGDHHSYHDWAKF